MVTAKYLQLMFSQYYIVYECLSAEEQTSFSMASREEMTLPATRPKSRKSLGHVASSVTDQENATADIGALAGKKRAPPIERPSKKIRSKSIGPGGLDALRDTSGNRREVRHYLTSKLKPDIPKLTVI